MSEQVKIEISAAGLHLTHALGYGPTPMQIPAVAKTAFPNPSPARVHADGRLKGQIGAIPAAGDDANKGYLGYVWRPQASAGRAVECLRGVLIEGFTGVTPGAEVYIDTAAYPTGSNLTAAYSGLTHDQPEEDAEVSVEAEDVAVSVSGGDPAVTSTGTIASIESTGTATIKVGKPIGVGISETGIFFYP